MFGRVKDQRKFELYYNVYESVIIENNQERLQKNAGEPRYCNHTSGANICGKYNQNASKRFG
jgi:hypothetical protein